MAYLSERFLFNFGVTHLARRRYYHGPDYTRALSIAELRLMAKRRLPAFAFEYLESGGEDELSLSWNRDIFRSLRFVPRTLVDTGERNIKTKYLGQEYSSPLIIAPTGHINILRRNGDVCLAQAAEAEGIPFTLSTLSNTRLERLSQQTAGRLWMQLYSFKDAALTNDIIDRADAAGYEALVFTTDSNVFGWREWDRRRFRRPGELRYRDVLNAFLHPKWFADVMIPNGVPSLENVVDFFPANARNAKAAATVVPDLFVPTISWDTVAEIRSRWKKKLLIKGILNADDADRAVDAGCDGIVLSNHGGRHLDSCVSPIEILPEVAERVQDKITIIIDSGFRRGSDVVKAIALGAHAVMIGRATLYGLASSGQPGVVRALQLINKEIERVLGQIGCRSLADLNPSYLRINPSFTPQTVTADL